MRSCKFCHQEFDDAVKHQMYASHVANCPLNPTLKERANRIRASLTQERLTVEIVCLKCGTPFTITCTQKNLDKGNHKKHCSRSCANGHVVTKDTAKKISQSLRSKSTVSVRFKNSDRSEILPKKTKAKLTCSHCGAEFENFPGRKYCSKNCGRIASHNNVAYRQNLSQKRIEAIQRGVKNDYGRRCTYVWKDAKIRCDSGVEYAGIDYVLLNYDVARIDRCDELKVVIPYVDDAGQDRKFIPDFMVTLNDGSKMIVECKGHVPPASQLNVKWKKYAELAELKRVVLAEYARQNNIESLWFTNKMHSKFYNRLKTRLASMSHEVESC